jgi:monoterpene epsilon-lactone hydrolase
MSGRFVWIFLTSFWRTFVRRLRRGPLRASWSLSFEAVVSALRRDWEATADWAFDRLRADMDARPYPRAMVRKVDVFDAMMGGVPVRVFEPPAAKKRHDGTLVFFHGGSYIFGSSRTTHADTIARLALECGIRIVAPEYRLAPEHPFPAQLEDALAVFDAVVADGTGPVLVGGDSAGGNLAVALSIALRDRGGSRPRGAVLLSPWCDLTMPGGSFVTNDAFDYGTRESLLRQARAFAGSVPLDDPRISPAFANLEGLEPTFVTAGELEIPRDDIEAFAARLRDAGVDTTFHLAPDMPHNAAFFADYHPSGRVVIDAIARLVDCVVDQRLPSSSAIGTTGAGDSSTSTRVNDMSSSSR